MNHLDVLESQSIFIFREAFNRIDKLAMLWSLGKDSNVMIWLARKAFFGHVPFPVMHIDTENKFPEMDEFRNRYAAEWGLDYISVTCPPSEGHGFTGVIEGLRRDEAGATAGERYFSLRGAPGAGNIEEQPPEFWGQFNTAPPPGTHLRIHPLLHWTEIDIWRYTSRENIPALPLYFARSSKRYRSLGDAHMGLSLDSTAATIAEIIAELEATENSQPSELFQSSTGAMDWYHSPAILRDLDEFQVITQPGGLPLRFPVQDVYRFDDRRIIAGRIETGVLRVGDSLLFSPANRVGKVKTIEASGLPGQAGQATQANAGESIGITLEEQILAERGDVASHETNPPKETDVFLARLFWLGERDLVVGSRYTMKLNRAEVGVAVQSIERLIATAGPSIKEAVNVARGEVAEITLRADTMQALDAFTASPLTGRFVLLDNDCIAGGGIISMQGYADQRHLIARRSSNVQRVAHDVTAENRASRNGHQGGVLWLTGLSGAGKSTVAVGVERRLFDLGYQTYVLDGDNVRHGLNGDLGFSPEDRAENIRRVGEVAGLLSRAGLLCVTAFISPYRLDRERARLAGGDQFAEIFIKADLATCEQRDPKGLYKKARAGEIPDFTGISAPYEAPEAPELVVDTSSLSVKEAVERVVGYVQSRFAIDAKRMPD